MYSPEEVETGGFKFNPLNAELNPICHMLALLEAHHIFYVSRIRVNITAWNETCLQWKEIKPLVLSVISKLHCIIKKYLFIFFYILPSVFTSLSSIIFTVSQLLLL
jgi:hypothetical protein